MKRTGIAIIALLAACSPAIAQNISENFDDIGTLPGKGWASFNQSQPLGATNWFQGNPSVFPAQQGAPNSYIGANFNNTQGATGTISNWLVTPTRTYRNGDTISFWSRSIDQASFPDRLEVRLSTNGASIDAGSDATSVGDFSTLLLSINPSLNFSTYPDEWTRFEVIISGLAGDALGRVAFRYFVTDAGPLGDNSNYIGIDTVDIMGVNLIPLPTAGAMGFAGIGLLASRRRRSI